MGGLLKYAQHRKRISHMTLKTLRVLIIYFALHPASLLAVQRGAAEQPPDLPPRVYLRVHALCIGIDKYRSPGIPDVPFGVNDAESIGLVLKEKYGYTVRTLIGPRATKENILEALNGYRSELGPDEGLIVFFAGHGQTVQQIKAEQGQRGYLIPYDARLSLKDTSDPGEWEEQAIGMGWLGNQAKACKARHVLILADACFSGFIGRRGGLSGREDLRQLISRPSRIAITSGTEGQSAFSDTGLNHGIFTHFLLNELRTGESISAMELFEWVRRGVADRSGGTMTPQFREIVINNGEFVFIPTALSDKEAAAAVIQFNQQLIAREKKKTTLDDLRGVLETNNYRYAVDAPEKERVWRARFKRFADNASLGDPVAMACMVYSLRKGVGVQRNDRKAYQWAQQAFQTGDATGIEAMSFCLYDGVGVERNQVAALKLMKAAADNGSAMAKSALAYDLLSTNPTAAEVKTAVKLLNEAIGGGSNVARTLLASCYNGDYPGYPLDARKAVAIATPAAENGYPKAQFLLYEIYSRGLPGVQRDQERALLWLKRSASAGLAVAQSHLGTEHYPKRWTDTQLNLDNNFDEVRKWSELAAAQNEPVAQMSLSMMCQYGDGVPVDYQRARNYLERAAKAGLTPAILRLGILHRTGGMYPKDNKKALQFYKTAAAMKSAEACYWLGVMTAKEEGEVQMRNESYYERYDPMGLTRMIDRDEIRAESLHWFIQSVKFGYPDAITRIKEMDYLIDASTLGRLRRNHPESYDDLSEMIKSDLIPSPDLRRTFQHQTD